MLSSLRGTGRTGDRSDAANCAHRAGGSRQQSTRGCRAHPHGRRRAIAKTISESLDGSLQRLKMDHVDIFHLHNPITSSGGETLSIAQVRNEVIPAFEALRRSGKAHFLGITAIGDTEALTKIIDAEPIHSAQVSYNMLNPSAAVALPPNYPAQDYGRLFDHTQVLA